jgi:hypothetical protein
MEESSTPPAAGLTVNLADRTAGPVFVFPKRMIRLDNFQGARGTKRHAAVAGNAFALVGNHNVHSLS